MSASSSPAVGRLRATTLEGRDGRVRLSGRRGDYHAAEATSQDAGFCISGDCLAFDFIVGTITTEAAAPFVFSKGAAPSVVVVPA